MLFSVITINRNNADGLRKTIASVLSQDFSQYEYIVIDGASTDDSVQVAEDNAGSISAFVSEPDKGIYDAMNKGIRMAHGDYVIFMNSGDTFVDCRILSRVAATAPAADFLIGGMRQRREGRRYTAVEMPATVTAYALLYRNFCHQATFARRQVLLELGGYDLSVKVAADACLLMLAAIVYRKTFATLPFCICDYDVTGMSSHCIDVVTAEKHDYFRRIAPNVYPDYVYAHRWLRLLPSNVLRVARLRITTLLSRF